MVNDYIIFDKMYFPVCIIGSDGQLNYVNDVFKNQIGVDDNSIMLDVEHPLYPEYRKRIAISYHKAFSGKQTKCFAVMKSVNGDKLPVEIYLYPMNSSKNEPEILAFFKLVEDRIISFDKTATPISDQQYGENTNFYEFSPFPVIRFDKAHNIQVMSASIEEVVGCSRDELKTQPDKFFKVLSKYDYERIKKTMNDLFEGSIRFKRLNDLKVTSLKNKDVFVNAILYPIKQDMKDETVEILFEDITKIKKYEEKLGIMNRGQIIVDLTKGLLHSFSNIINIISSRSQMLLSLNPDKILHDGLRVINKSSKDATRQIRRVQEFVEREDSIDDADDVEDINEILEDAIAFSRIHFNLEKKEKGREILLKKDKFKKLKVIGNIKLLREILVSMVFKVSTNIAKQGEIEIFLRESEDLFVEISTKKINDETEQKQGDQVYPFSEIEIRRIAEKINIRIYEEESSEKFSIKAIIPAKMLKMQKKDSYETDNSRINGFEILVVEEEIALCEVLQDFYEGLGNNVTICKNGITALKRIRDNHYDMVISDYSITGLTGLEFLAKVKELNENILTVLLSGWIINDLKDYTSIVDLYVPKPFQLDDLTKDISKLIKQ